MNVYSSEFIRTGFQGGLNYYRVAEHPSLGTELRAFTGRTIDVPACYIGGDSEWAVYQTPGALESMHQACTRLVGIHLVKQAGHSIPEEQPRQVNAILIEFLRQAIA
jgi:pimeloyl-ACP methyl ester carboxylesterase